MGHKDAAERFHWILHTRFQGSQSEMARTLGISQAHLSRVVNGIKQPGTKLLAALGSLPGLNLNWALYGEGEPFLKEEARIPLFPRFLAESPENYLNEGSSYVLPESQKVVTPTRYLVQISEHEPVLHDPNEKIAVGDLVLVETNSTYWLQKTQRLRNALCVLASTQGADLARVVGEPEDGRIDVQVFAKAAPQTARYGPSTTRRRSIRLDPGPPPEIPVIAGQVIQLWRYC